MHNDAHLANLMLLDDGTPVAIDFNILTKKTRLTFLQAIPEWRKSPTVQSNVPFDTGLFHNSLKYVPKNLLFL